MPVALDTLTGEDREVLQEYARRLLPFTDDIGSAWAAEGTARRRAATASRAGVFIEMPPVEGNRAGGSSLELRERRCRRQREM